MTVSDIPVHKTEPGRGPKPTPLVLPRHPIIGMALIAALLATTGSALTADLTGQASVLLRESNGQLAPALPGSRGHFCSGAAPCIEIRAATANYLKCPCPFRQRLWSAT
jgi:hypothetical protein